MDFGYTEEQQDLVGLAGQILGERVTHEALTALDRKVEGDGAPRLDRDLWAELAKANLLGIGLPEEFGGSGYGVFEQCLILEQVGRTLAPVPFGPSIAVAASTLNRLGTQEQKQTWLPDAIAGTKILTYALAEPFGRDGAAPDTKAVQTDGTWRLDGVKTGVPAATVADLLLVSARIEAGAGVFLVDPTAAGCGSSRSSPPPRRSPAWSPWRAWSACRWAAPTRRSSCVTGPPWRCARPSSG